MIIFDLRHPSGPAEVMMHGIDALDAVARDPKRYMRWLPALTKLGPKQGVNRIVVSYDAEDFGPPPVPAPDHWVIG
jgi:hypothetical protein